jgi:hemolysin activation/secretion protein
MKRRLALAVLLAHSAVSTAQTRPGAGQVLRELGRPDAAPRPAPAPAPPIVAPPEPRSARPDDDAAIVVAGFHVSGATAFPPARLERLLDPWRGRALTLAELQDAAERISSHYREHGYLLARAYLPAQTISDQRVEIAVLEGRVGEVIIDSRDDALARQARAITDRIEPGRLAKEAELERMLLLLNDSSGIERADAALRPGASVGLSDLVVTLQPGPAATGEVGASNHGNRYTGRHLAGGALTLNSPARIGDQFSARFQGSDERLLYTRLGYRLPLGGAGLIAGAAWTYSRYRLGGDFAALDAHGDARIGSLFAYYPLLLTRGFSLTATVAAERKSLSDSVEALSTEAGKKITLGTAGLSGNLRWRGGGYAFSLAYTGGTLAIQDPEARDVDAATARSAGHYAKWVYAASVTQPLARAWLASAQVNGQYARKNLDSSEKFSLGGADGVRAYPQGEAPADAGVLLTLALRRALPPPMPGGGDALLGGFIDAGKVRINHTPFAAGDNRRRLAAVGVSLDCPLPADFQLRGSLAWKLGTRDASSDRDRGMRAWLSATRYF